MERHILYISESESFLAKAMMNTFSENNFKVSYAHPNPEELSEFSELPDILIINLDGEFGQFLILLTYLKIRLSEGETRQKIFFLGTQNTISAVKDNFPHFLISGTFVTPVNTKDIVTKLNSLFQTISTSKRSILVVDDDSVILRGMKNLLSRDYDVFMVTSGVNAISFLAKRPVDLILLDYEMPVVSGLQVFEMLKSEERTASIPVIFLTAKDDKETVMKVLTVKPEKYLLKNMPSEQLVKSIADFFEGR